MIVGVDTGGTFTDFVVFDGNGLHVHKVLSTPQAPEQAILQGLQELGLAMGQFQLVHGSTVATNAVLEGKGVPTVYITNRGLGDVLTIGRQARRELYNLQPELVRPPVAPECCLETGGRIAATGEVIEPLTEPDLEALRAEVERLAPRAVAINLLFSYLDDSAERAIEAALPEALFVSRSSYVLQEYREYERGMATFLNAYVGPLVQGYLQRLAQGVSPAPVAVMQSSGETVSAGQAGELAVHLLLSGPAGGLMGARFTGQASHCERLLTFDMGGTSTDVALIDGAPRLTTEGRIGDWPVAVPMVEMETIGAGGGSIARLDAGGLLQVGPESAGADPGPACYGRGGLEPTVTDANLVLGRLPADTALGGYLQLDMAAARAAVARVAEPLAVSVEAAAEGIIALANEHMARALRTISVNRGEDPASYVLTCFGGAGGLHVCALAEALDMREALVPVHAGVLSALGMLVTPRGRQLSRTLNRPLDGLSTEHIDRELALLEVEGRNALLEEGVAAEAVAVESSLDLRYLGQSFTLNLPWSGLEETLAAFHAEHERRYGHRLAKPVELVNVRIAVRGPLPKVALAGPEPVMPGAPGTAPLEGVGESVPVWQRDGLPVGEVLTGPLLVTESVATTYVAPGWTLQAETSGNLRLRRAG